jgi:hypothetical protein
MNWDERFATFVELNADVRIEANEESVRILNPWRDDTFALETKSEKADDLADALNYLIPPPRFSAVFHVDQKRAEFIYTYLPPDHELSSRKFKFVFEDLTVYCEFGRASERLLRLASAFKPTGPPKRSYYRNLPLISPPSRTEASNWVPVSFWIGPLPDFSDGLVIDIAKHLNFCMRYYDRHSPQVMLHSEAHEDVQYGNVAMINDQFPGELHIGRVDQFLLDLSAAAIEASDSRATFIYHYQILEHAAFYALDDKTRRQVLNILRSPDLQFNAESYVPKILDLLGAVRTGEDAKLAAIVASRVSPEHVWRELEVNHEYLCNRHEFDGGFVLEPFLSGDTTFASFMAMWLPKTTDTLRHIRNALVHAREVRSGAVIAPTPRNDDLLRPWVVIIERISEQLMLNE